jgi:hypothetical protein
MDCSNPFMMNGNGYAVNLGGRGVDRRRDSTHILTQNRPL